MIRVQIFYIQQIDNDKAIMGVTSVYKMVHG